MGDTYYSDHSSQGSMFIVGHRGARAVEPENTFRAIRTATRCARYVEVDVRLSRDRVPVILHDPDLERTTNGTGPVGNHDLSDLRRLDAGKGERVPTLEEVCREVRGRCGLVVEMKEPGSEKEVSAVLRDADLPDLLLVSFHAACIRAMHSLLPGVVSGLIFSQTTPDPLSTAAGLGCRAVLPKFSLVTPGLVRASRASGLQVIAWTLNSPGEFRKAGELGIDGFATDDPCRARDFFLGKFPVTS
jgi:glycerophosphoryl diester phosphodiesterase